MRKSALLVLFVVPCLAGSGCSKPSVDGVRVERGAVAITVTSVESGVVEPDQKSSLASPIAARIARVKCREGERVRAGQVLVELENDLEKLREEETERDLARLRGLGRWASEEELQHADWAYRQAKANYERTLIVAPFDGLVAQLEARVGESTYGAGVTGSLGAASSAGPLIYLVDDSQLFLKAEIDESDVARIAVGQPARVTFGGNAAQEVAGRVSRIAPVVSTDEEESRTAEVEIALLLDAAPANFDYRGTPPAHDDKGDDDNDGNDDGDPSGSKRGGRAPRVFVGMSADLEILVKRVDDVLRIPTSVLVEDGAERFVYVARGGVLERRVVRVGAGNWEWSEVREGLALGDVVVIPADLKALKNGLEVEVRMKASP